MEIETVALGMLECSSCGNLRENKNKNNLCPNCNLLITVNESSMFKFHRNDRMIHEIEETINEQIYRYSDLVCEYEDNDEMRDEKEDAELKILHLRLVLHVLSEYEPDELVF